MHGRDPLMMEKAVVSMKSGLEGRNNHHEPPGEARVSRVSMKSGLEGRNNPDLHLRGHDAASVSMKSGLEGRNNVTGSFTYRQEVTPSQ